MEKKIKIIPQHKMEQWVLPGVPKHRKKSGKKKWKIEAKYHGPKPKHSSWGHMCHDRTAGRYQTRVAAEKALVRFKNNPAWKHFTFEIKKTRKS